MRKFQLVCSLEKKNVGIGITVAGFST